MSALYTFLSSLYNCLFEIYFVNIIRGNEKVLRGGAENLWRCKVVPREVCTSTHLPPKAGLGKLCEIRPASTTQGHFANIQFPMSNPKKPYSYFHARNF